METLIRKARVDDFDVFARLVLEVHDLHVQQVPWMFRMPADGEVWSQADFTTIVKGESSVILLAEVDGQAVGFAHLQVGEIPDLPIMAPRRFCSIDSIGVSAAWQGQGIGQQLMAAAEAWARKKGVDELTLSVHEFNQTAIRFYQRQGYQGYLRRMRLPLRPKDPPAG